MHEHTKDALDAGAGGIALSAWLGWLPEVAALLAILWTGIRIYEWMRVRFFGYEPIALISKELSAIKTPNRKGG